jgi:hypothetical protein
LFLTHKYYLQVGVGYGEEIEVLRSIKQRLDVAAVQNVDHLALTILGVDINEGK